jgi:hypothetical protein
MLTLLKRSTWVLLAVLLGLPSAGMGQGRPQTREGFFIGVGLGWGSLGCADCVSRESSGAAELKLGGALNPQLLIGGASTVWTKKDASGTRLTHGTVTFMAQYYPSVTSGFWVKGGVGVAQLMAESTVLGVNVTVTDNGLGLNAGLGYDVRVGTNFSLSPYSSWSWGSFEGGSADHFQLGLGVTWH